MSFGRDSTCSLYNAYIRHARGGTIETLKEDLESVFAEIREYVLCTDAALV